mgnify:CR=1 FL=1
MADEPLLDAKDFLTEQHLRIIQSIIDLQMALSAAEFMSEVCNEDRLTRVIRRRHRCFEDAAVIAYGRAFTDSKGLVAFSFKLLKFKPTPIQQELHERLLDRRKKVVAHSDAERQRILFQTEKFEADTATVMLPHIDSDDALHFFDDRMMLIEWLGLLIKKASSVIFEVVQGKPPMRFLRDYKFPIST